MYNASSFQEFRRLYPGTAPQRDLKDLADLPCTKYLREATLTD